MIIGASILQLPAIEKAMEMGLAVVALDMNPDDERIKNNLRLIENKLKEN